MAGRKPKQELPGIDRGKRKEDAPETIPILENNDPIKPTLFINDENDPILAKANFFWDKYAPGLIRRGLLTDHDVPLFTMFCVLWGEFNKDPIGFAPQKVGHFRQLAAAFGMDPTNRPAKPDAPKEKTGFAGLKK